MSSTPWGVDLSPTYNPTVDAEAIAAAGASYAILKVSEGVGWPDAALHPDEFAWFSRVGTDVVDAGLELRVYHLGTPSDRADALAEAAWFDRHLGVSLPGAVVSIAYDLEELAPGLSPPEHVDVYQAWRSCIAGFLPGIPIELYLNQSVRDSLAPFLPPGEDIWLAWPGWTPDRALYSSTMRVQIGQRLFPTMPGHPVDIDVAPNCTLVDLYEALGRISPSPAPTPPAPAPAPPSSTDWSLLVQTLDLRNAATTPVRGQSVKALQTLLKLATALPLAIDGIAGPDTRRVLGTFQASMHGLAVDYIAGPQTWEALCRQ